MSRSVWRTGEGVVNLREKGVEGHGWEVRVFAPNGTGLSVETFLSRTVPSGKYLGTIQTIVEWARPFEGRRDGVMIQETLWETCRVEMAKGLGSPKTSIDYSRLTNRFSQKIDL